MATANYDEASHTTPMDWNSMDPLYRWDTHFPERFSRLHMHDEFKTPSPPPHSSGTRRNRRVRNRNSLRFKTQPITFDEIKEVDEEGNVTTPKVKDTKKDLKDQFAAFSRSMEGVLPGFTVGVIKKGSRAKEPSASTSTDCGPASVDAAQLVAQPKDEDVFTSTGSSDNTVSCAAHGLPTDLLPQHDASRARRLKRRQQRRSIEEEPENEDLADLAKQNTG